MTGYDALTNYPLQTYDLPTTKRHFLVPGTGFKSYVLSGMSGSSIRIFGTDTQASVVASTLNSTGYEVPAIAGFVMVCLQDMYMRIEFFNQSTLEVTTIAKDTEFDENVCPDSIIVVQQKLSNGTVSVKNCKLFIYEGYDYSIAPHIGITNNNGTYKLRLDSTSTTMGEELETPFGVFVKPVGDNKSIDIKLGAMQSEIRDVKNQVNAISTVTTQAIARFPMR